MSIQDEFVESMKPVENYILDFPWENERAYSEWVAQTYYFVLQSTRLFACASSRCNLNDNKLHFRLIHHLGEERGHENLALHDLKVMNKSILDIPELPETSSLYQIQYYWIEHVNPAAFFGYLLCLEGLAVRVGKPIYQRVSQAHGKNAGTFLKVHVEEDESHLSEAFEYVNQFSAIEVECVMQNLSQSASLYKRMLENIVGRRENSRIAVA